MKSYFYLPDFYSNAVLINFLADMMEQAPECFYEGTRIASAYGAFPNSIWNGGRTFLDRISQKKMRQTIEGLNSRGIAVRYTFTNPLIEEKHLQDTFCNLSLELAAGKGNEVLVNSPILEQYIRENYPDFKLISSTTKCLDKEQDIREELEKDYFLVVLDSAVNNTELLYSLDHKEKIELIVNHRCEDNCPRRRAHYIAQAKAQLGFTDQDFPACPNLGKDFYQLTRNRSFISDEMIHGGIYSQMGFMHYKLDGRGWEFRNLVESFIYYLVKPEWRDKVRQTVLREVFRF